MPGYMEIVARRADLLYHMGQCDQALELLFEHEKQSPDPAALHLRRVEMLVDSGRHQRALELLSEVSSADPEGCFLMLRGFCHEALGNLQEAKRAAAKLFDLGVQRANALILQARVAWQLGNRPMAEKNFREAIAWDNNCALGYLGLGYLSRLRKNQKECLEFFEKAFLLSPSTRETGLAFHEASVETQDYVRAEAAFRIALRDRLFHRRLRFILIDLLLRQSKYEEAMAETESVMVDFGTDDGMLSAAMSIRQRVGPLDGRVISKSRRTISLCMIVKNEERYLGTCLFRIKPAVDEIIVVDTGSADRTKDIAAAFGAKVFDFPWTNDFSEARNYSLSQATGHWLLVLDADEIISPLDFFLLKKIVNEKSNERYAYAMTTRNYVHQPALRGWVANDGKYADVERGKGWVPSSKVRLFGNHKNIRFVGAVHELVEPTLKKQGVRIRRCEIPVHHYGKLIRNKNVAKGAEYYRLGKKKREETNGGYQALKELAIQASEIGEYAEAVGLWEQAIGPNSSDATAYMNAGYAYFMLNQYETAAVHSKKALEIDPDLREAALNYAGCEFMLGNLKETLLCLEKILEKEPGYPPAVGRIAAAYLLSGRRKEAFTHLGHLSRKGYDCFNILSEQAKALVFQGSKDQAKLLEEAAFELKIPAGDKRPLPGNVEN